MSSSKAGLQEAGPAAEMRVQDRARVKFQGVGNVTANRWVEGWQGIRVYQGPSGVDCE